MLVSKHAWSQGPPTNSLPYQLLGFNMSLVGDRGLYVQDPHKLILICGIFFYCVFNKYTILDLLISVRADSFTWSSVRMMRPAKLISTLHYN